LVGIGTRLWSKGGILFRSVAAQFFIASVVTIFASMLVLGSWVSHQIKHSVLVATGVQTSLFAETILAPFVQDLEAGGTLDEASINAIDALLGETPFADLYVSIKIWRSDGLVLYATNHDLIGQLFDPIYVREAAAGKIVAQFESVYRSEHAHERLVQEKLVEVYAPLFRTGSDEVLAIAETYERGNALSDALDQSQQMTWLVVATAATGLVGCLYLIVWRASQTIVAQRKLLRSRIVQQSRLAQQNRALRLAADKARLNASTQTEHHLSRIGSDLHDGPLQLLTLSTLKMTSAVRILRTAGIERKAVEQQIETAVEMTQNALGELRAIATGLSLPEIAGLTLLETIHRAVERHQAHTGNHVELSVVEVPEPVSEALKTCAFRVVQEGLNNAAKHSPNAAATVSVALSGDTVEIQVHDDGPGDLKSLEQQNGRAQLGLSGLRNRVAALNGRVNFSSTPADGTLLKVNLPLNQQTMSR